jgi:hypothetical protein
MKTYTLKEKIALCSNAIVAEQITREECRRVLGRHNSNWCKAFFAKHFPRLLNCRMGRILMGVEVANKTMYYYTPNPF